MDSSILGPTKDEDPEVTRSGFQSGNPCFVDIVFILVGHSLRCHSMPHSRNHEQNPRECKSVTLSRINLMTEGYKQSQTLFRHASTTATASTSIRNPSSANVSTP